MKHPGLINKSSSVQPKIFKWTLENLKKIERIIEKYPKNEVYICNTLKYRAEKSDKKGNFTFPK